MSYNRAFSVQVNDGIETYKIGRMLTLIRTLERQGNAFRLLQNQITHKIPDQIQQRRPLEMNTMV